MGHKLDGDDCWGRNGSWLACKWRLVEAQKSGGRSTMADNNRRARERVRDFGQFPLGSLDWCLAKQRQERVSWMCKVSFQFLPLCSPIWMPNVWCKERSSVFGFRWKRQSNVRYYLAFKKCEVFDLFFFFFFLYFGCWKIQGEFAFDKCEQPFYRISYTKCSLCRIFWKIIVMLEISLSLLHWLSSSLGRDSLICTVKNGVSTESSPIQPSSWIELRWCS